LSFKGEAILNALGRKKEVVLIIEGIGECIDKGNDVLPCNPELVIIIFGTTHEPDFVLSGCF
jgi:hypothetical protein